MNYVSSGVVAESDKNSLKVSSNSINIELRVNQLDGLELETIEDCRDCIAYVEQEYIHKNETDLIVYS